MPVPRWTLGLVAALVLVQWVPGAADLLAYDRGAVLGGESWRIVTGHFIHYSWAHLANNLAALVPAAWLVETRYRNDGLPLVLGASVAIGIALLVGEPGVVEFRGASGVALALLGYVGLRGLHEHRRWRMVCGLLLVLLTAKLVAEAAGWRQQDWQHDGFVAVWLSHLAGAMVGVAVYLRHVGRNSNGLPLASSR